MTDAPGAPGIAPRWTSSDKSGLGTALSASSQVWFTLSHGILNECYYPRVDQACTRDLGFIVTDGYRLFAEEKRDTDSVVRTFADGVPAYELTNTHRPGEGAKSRFRIVKQVISDPRRDVVLQRVRLDRLDNSPLRLHALLAPHLVNAGTSNTAWLGDYKGQQMLFAEGGGAALALAASRPWRARSAGYAGTSDGWQDLSRHFKLTWSYDRAVDGNVALVGEVALPEDDTVVFALGFGASPMEAAFRARASLADDFDELAAEYVDIWRRWQAGLRPLDRRVAPEARGNGTTPEARGHDSTPTGQGQITPETGLPGTTIPARGETTLQARGPGTVQEALGAAAAPEPHGQNTPEAHVPAKALPARGETTSEARQAAQPEVPRDTARGPYCRNTYRVSTAVLRTHEAPSFRGGYIASLSIPWGATKGEDDLGGYHLVWPRDLVETAGGLLAAGAHAEALRILDYLRTTQEQDGHWPQNNWLDGSSYWQGVQMDECAFPILLLDLLLREGALRPDRAAAYWPMVRDAAGFLVRNGPATGQDRWEENAGFSTFTLAVEIAALLAAADQADHAGQTAASAFLTDTADAWHAALDDWTFARGTGLAAELGVDGYYVRMAPNTGPGAGADLGRMLQIKNRPEGQGAVAASDVVSADALALVRFGLRAASDPRILATMRAIDHCTRTELPAGPSWHRYTGDGYGEHEDGAPFDGTGIGRLWPLLTGERAHVAVAAGDLAQARALLDTMESCASSGALLPEQVWDSADIPERELYRGHPSGSAMPLVWAHAEHVKLLRSIADGAVFDMPAQTVRRYVQAQNVARVTPWRPGFQPDRLDHGRALRIELPRPSVVLWSKDDWASSAERRTTDTGLGLHAAEIAWDECGDAQAVVFTWRDAETNAWAGSNMLVRVT